MLLQIKLHIDLHTAIDGNFSTTLSLTERSSRHKLKRRILELTDVIKQMDLTELYRIFLPKTIEYTFFEAPYGIFSKIGPIFEHKASVTIHKKKKTTFCILSDHHRLNLDINKRKLKTHGN